VKFFDTFELSRQGWSVDVDPIIVAASVGVGLLVGFTGVGAGALMTPMLVVFFGVPPAVAIATDLVFAALTKIAGGLVHIRHGRVQWKLLKPLWVGGIGGTFLGIGAVFLAVEADRADDLLRIPLATLILVAAASMASRAIRPNPARSVDTDSGKVAVRPLALGGGAAIGLAVSLTSVGAGALGMALLSKLSPPNTPPKALVGTDLFFATPIAVLAGTSYLIGGLVNLSLLVSLLIGSIPGVVVGSLLSVRAPERLLAFLISAALVAAATMVIQ
jgi:uncharacterized protein